MSGAPVTASPAPPINQQKLFILSCLALVTAGLAFSLRASSAGDLQHELFDPIDKLKSAEMLDQHWAWPSSDSPLPSRSAVHCWISSAWAGC